MEEFKCGDFTCATEWVGESSVVVAVRGELDMHTSEEVGHMLNTLQDLGVGDHLAIDLTDCAFIDSIGLSVLIEAQHVAKSPLNIVVTHEALRRVLSVTGLASIFMLHETKAEALGELERQVGAL